jgi:hypothetical protein
MVQVPGEKKAAHSSWLYAVDGRKREVGYREVARAILHRFFLLPAILVDCWDQAGIHQQVSWAPPHHDLHQSADVISQQGHSLHQWLPVMSELITRNNAPSRE